jgi:aerobic carbon-monoxide dehydrogenase medium subunit
MMLARLKYHAPETLAEASDILDACKRNIAILGGGTQVVPALTRNELSIEHMLDPRKLNLDRITIERDMLQIGARATYHDVITSALVAEWAPLIAKASRGVTGGAQLTRSATLIGAACWNFPGSDMPGVLTALQADFLIFGIAGERIVPAADFFVGAGKVLLQPGEMVTGFRVARNTIVGYCKIKHSAGSWPIATASAVKERQTGKIRVTLGAVTETPVTMADVDEGSPDTEVSEAVANPWSDQLAPGNYRSMIAPVAVRRALADMKDHAQ